MKGSVGSGAVNDTRHPPHNTSAANTKSGTPSTSSVKQPTAEQIRQAKLSQLPSHDDRRVESVITQVSEVTGKPSDMVSVALHDCNYDANTAIQNLLDGLYDSVEFEWTTTATKKKRSANTLVSEQAPNTGRHSNHGQEEYDMKPATKSNRQQRGKQGRGGKRNTDEESSGIGNQSREMYHSRGRGRGRGGIRGDNSGGREGISRGRGGAARSRGRSSRGKVGGGRGRFGDNDRSAGREDTTALEPNKFADDECWDSDPIPSQVAASIALDDEKGWGDDPVEEHKNLDTPWGQVVDAPQVNGTAWGDQSSEISSKPGSDPVDRSQPVDFSFNNLPTSPSATKEEAESNQFPSASDDVEARHLDVAAYSTDEHLLTSKESSEPAHAPMISGIHESHMLEADLLAPKGKTQKTRRHKTKSNDEPVQMPQGLYDDVGDVSQQLGGLEFGGSSLSPVLPKPESLPTDGQLSSMSVTQSPPSSSLESYRHVIAPSAINSFAASQLNIESQTVSANDKPKTPPGLGSLPGNQASHHYSGPITRHHLPTKALNPIPYPKKEKAGAPGLMSIPSSVKVPPYKSSIPNNRKVPDSVGNSHSSEFNQSALHHINIADSSSQPAKYVASSLVSPGNSSTARNQSGVSSVQSNAALSDSVLSSHASTYNSTSSKQFQTSGASNKHGQPSGGMPLNMYPNVQPGIIPTYQHQPMASPMPYDDMGLPGIPMAPYYDMMFVHPNASQTAGNGRNDTAYSGDGKFVRDAAPAPAVSTISQVNQHTGQHHVPQPGYLNAANPHLPYHHYAYAYPGSFPVFTTAPLYQQLGNGKGHGAQYQSHSSHSYNSGGGGQEYGSKAFSYASTVTQSSQSGKQSQSSGAVGSTTSSDSNLQGYNKAGFGHHDMKAYVASPTIIPMPHGPTPMGGHGHTPMGGYGHTPFMMQQSMIHPNSQVLDAGGGQGSMHPSRPQGQHHTVGSGGSGQASQKRENKSSYWSGTS